MSEIRIDQLNVNDVRQALVSLSEILRATVEAGGAIGFVHPVSQTQARSFWARDVCSAMECGDRLLWVACVDEDGQARPAGTIQLILGMPDNQPHRAELAKLMVAPWARRRGLARALVAAAEQAAVQAGRTLMTMDTRQGEGAETLYAAMGYEIAGIIPDYALNPMGDGRHATTLMYKHL